MDGCRGPIMSAVLIVDHHQLSIASSTVSWRRLASASRSLSRVSSALGLGQDVRLAHAAATCRFLSPPMTDLLSLKCIVHVLGARLWLTEALKQIDRAVPHNVDPAISCRLEHMRSECSSSNIEKGAMPP